MPDIGQIASTVTNLVDNLTTTRQEMGELKLKQKELEHKRLENQTDTNQVEARHKSVFVAGWRPAIGWVGAIGFFYQFILYPLLLWFWSFAQAKGWIAAGTEPPPVMEVGPLMTLLTGMLGIGIMRSFDKTRGTDTDVVESMSKREFRLRKKLARERAAG